MLLIHLYRVSCNVSNYGGITNRNLRNNIGTTHSFYKLPNIMGEQMLKTYICILNSSLPVFYVHAIIKSLRVPLTDTIDTYSLLLQQKDREEAHTSFLCLHQNVRNDDHSIFDLIILGIA